MKKRNIHLTALAMAAAWAACAPMALAVTNGFIPTASTPDNAVINPFTGQVTTVWKLMGTFGCSAHQITREWIMTAAHCSAAGTNQTGTFVTGRGTSDFSWLKCHNISPLDVTICRLSNPGNLAPPNEYPVLTSLPDTWLADPSNARKYGSLMAYGKADISPGLAFVDLAGLPVIRRSDGSLKDYDTTVWSTLKMPDVANNDSGGALYWFPPAVNHPHLIGVLSGSARRSTQAAVGPLIKATEFFTPEVLAAIHDKIVANGDAPPALVDASIVFQAPIGEQARILPQKPTFARVGSTERFTLNWQTPVSTPAITRFMVSLGEKGVQLGESTAGVGGSTNSLTLDLPAKRVDVCIQPFNAIAGSLSITKYADTIESMNCIQVDNMANLTVINGPVSSPPWINGSIGIVSFSWTAPPVPADIALKGFQVQQAVTTSGGLTRTSTSLLTTNRVQLSAPTGSRVCLNVRSVAMNGKLGPLSSNSCVVMR